MSNGFWYLICDEGHIRGALSLWSPLLVKVFLLVPRMKLTISSPENMAALWQQPLPTSMDTGSLVISLQPRKPTERQELMEGKSNTRNKLLLQFKSHLPRAPHGLNHLPDLSSASLCVVRHRSGLLPFTVSKCQTQRKEGNFLFTSV